MKIWAMAGAALAMIGLGAGAAPAAAQQDSSVFGARSAPRAADGIFSWDRGHRRHRGFHGGFARVWVIEREVPVVVEREVVREVLVPANLGTPNTDVPKLPRKPYAIGASYASLPPGGCMKLIEDGVSYYHCGGEWYRQVGEGRSVSYRAVKREL